MASLLVPDAGSGGSCGVVVALGLAFMLRLVGLAQLAALRCGRRLCVASLLVELIRARSAAKRLHATHFAA